MSTNDSHPARSIPHAGDELAEAHPNPLHAEALAQKAEEIWSRPYAVPSCCWVSPDYLLWSIKKGPLPIPMATTGSLGALGTATLLGGSDLDYRAFSGGRLTAGFWFDGHGATIGLEGSGFVLQQRSVSRAVGSDAAGNPSLGIPFFNTATSSEDFAAFATPGQTVGRIDLSSSSQLWGAESNFLFNLYRDSWVDVGLLAGFRYLNLDEDLTLLGSKGALPGQLLEFAGDAFTGPAATTTTDRFTTHNRFYGCQVGAWAEYRHSGAFLNVGGKIGLGGVHEAVGVFGSSSFLAGSAGLLGTLPGGIFAQARNLGRETADTFAVVPELEVKVGYEFTKNWTAFIGYTFLYWSSVVRPGEQLNRQLSPTQVPTFAQFNPSGFAMQPFPLFNTTDFWAQGVNVGLEFRY